jgi:DNA-directed RNA polymerase subunit RPC12/RpoP
MAQESASATRDETKAPRECPYCKEEIKADAIKCKHCGSRLSPEQPTHGGVCPYCKEDVKPDAIKCKHCGSYLGAGQAEADPSASSDCGDCGGPMRQMQARQSIGPGAGYDSRCTRWCQIECRWAGGHPLWCWYACAWLCSGRVSVGDAGVAT